VCDCSGSTSTPIIIDLSMVTMGIAMVLFELLYPYIMMASPLPKVINCALSLGFYVIVVVSLICIVVDLENEGDCISLLLDL
jgi:hypothetical protein